MTYIAVRQVDENTTDVIIVENSRKKFHEKVQAIRKEHPDWDIEIDFT